MGTQAPVTVTPVSMDPDDFVTGGLLQDVDLEILKIYSTLEKPEHYKFDDRVFIKMEAKNLSTGGQEEQFWAAGSNADFVPSSDGNFILPNPDNPSATALRKASNWAAMLVSLKTNGGMPKGFLNSSKGLSALAGMRFHAMQAPAPERPGLEKKDSKFPPTVLICFKVLPGFAPWEAKKTAVAGTTRRVVTWTPAQAAPQAQAAAPAPSAPAAPQAAGSGTEDDKIISVVSALIDEAAPDENGVQKIPAVQDKSGIAALVFNKLVKHGFKVNQRTEASKKVLDAAWMQEHGFLIEDGFVYKIE